MIVRDMEKGDIPQLYKQFWDEATSKISIKSKVYRMSALNPDSYEYHHEYLEVVNKYNKELQRLLQELLVLESGKSPRI